MAKHLTVRFMIDRVLPACLFGMLGFMSVSQLVQHWTDPGNLQLLKVAHGLLSIIFAAMVAVLFVIRRPPVGQRASPLAIAIAIGGSFLPWLIVAQPPTIDDWRVLAFSDLLMIIGVAFTIYSLGTLGRCFGIAPEARGLVTSGAYRWVRNPAYLAEFLTVTGGALPLVAPLTICLFAAFCFLQVRRMALEEAVMAATFAEYAEYRQRTPALVPWRLLRLTPSAGHLHDDGRVTASAVARR
jgi:protein-S-isoprenylcysteine O-methyltransferase Ste14